MPIKVTNYQLFLSFFRIGVFTFGGGMAMLPWLEEELKKYHLDKDEILRIFSLAQSMPGMIATNVPTIVGRKLNGFWGSFWATLGVIMPSFLIILVIALGFSTFLYKPVVQGSLQAIRATASIMIIFSAIGLFRKIFQKKHFTRAMISLTIVVSIILLSFFTTLNPFIFILSAIFLATLEYFITKHRGKK